MNGRCKPAEPVSGQKNKEIYRVVTNVFLEHLGRGYCPPPRALPWLCL